MEPEDRGGKRAALALVALFLARTCTGFQFQTVGSMAGILGPALDARQSGIGTLIGLYTAPGVLLAWPAGAALRRSGGRAVCAMAMLLLVLGGIVQAFAPGYSTVCAGRLIGGAGTVLFNIVFPALVAEWFRGGRTTAAMSIGVVSWPFGIALCMVAMPALGAAAGWRGGFLSTAAVALPMGVLLLAFGIPAAPSRAAAGGARLSAAAARDATTTGLAWAFVNLGLVLFLSFGPGALAPGRDAIAASRVTSLALWTSLGAVPLGGWIIERTRIDRPLIGAAAILAAGCAAGFASGPAPVLAATLGLAIGPTGAILALPARRIPAEELPQALGLFYTWYYLLLTLGPPAVGWARDRSGSATLPLAIAALSFAAGALFLGMSRSGVHLLHGERPGGH